MSQTTTTTNQNHTKVPKLALGDSIKPIGFPPAWQGWTCPECGGSNLLLTIRPMGRGTGPSGTWRMGDDGRNVKACLDCGKASDGWGRLGLPTQVVCSSRK